MAIRSMAQTVATRARRALRILARRVSGVGRARRGEARAKGARRSHEEHPKHGRARGDRAPDRRLRRRRQRERRRQVRADRRAAGQDACHRAGADDARSDGDEGHPVLGERDIATKPKIPKAEGAAPKSLKVEDLIEGKGPGAKAGDKISVRYVGTLYDTNKEFDSSWKRGKAPFQLTLGQGQVIQGWDQGLVGMKVGGRRRLTIPPDLAYGAQGQPPTIPPNSTLVFDVDLTKIG